MHTQKLTASCLILACLSSAVHFSNGKSSPPAKASEVKAVNFLKGEVPAWSRNNGCFSCHNNGDAARALYTASRKGYRIPSDVLAETTGWLSDPLRWDNNKGDPGFSDLRLANLQFSLALLAAFEAGQVKDKRPLQAAARKVAADQDPSGAWLVDSGVVIGSPVTYGSTLATVLASRVVRAGGSNDHKATLENAERWLRRAPVASVSSAAALLLAAAAEPSSIDQQQQKECLATIERAQTQDGGWGPYLDSPPEAFDTAMALLSLAATKKSPRIAVRIRRGRTFLSGLQEPDGGWPATTRPSGGQSYAQRLSTTGWATLALLATSE